VKTSTALEGFKLFMSSGNYSQGTVRLYHDNLVHMIRFLNDPEVEKITLTDLQKFMTYMKTDYKPTRFSGDTSPISSSHLDNHWKAIRTFFRWSQDTLEVPRPDMKMARPRYRMVDVAAFSEDDIRAMLKACDYSFALTSEGKTYRTKRPCMLRDKAVLMVLLDSGMRIGEVCRMKCKDVDLVTGEMAVAPFGTGKKTKPRMVYLGKAARRALWLYMAKREYTKDDRLFDLNPNSARNLLKHIEKSSGVKNVHPHRFRHTFAIMYLRNGGDVFTLQRLLGHSDLEMTKRYLDITKSDLVTAHRLASPGDHMKL
jgi:integrase/recombinase XerD